MRGATGKLTRRRNLKRVEGSKHPLAAFITPRQSMHGDTKRGHPNTTTSDDPPALDGLVARETEINTILARLTALSSDHFSCEPETVTWADVGTLANYLKALRDISNFAFQEGEHAA